jgi:hypothetical protein
MSSSLHRARFSVVSNDRRGAVVACDAIQTGTAGKAVQFDQIGTDSASLILPQVSS